MSVVHLQKVGAKIGRTTKAVTGAYVAIVTDEVILANAVSGAFSITLPAAALSLDVLFDIKKIDASGNSVTVDGAGVETIDGQLTQLLTAQWSSITIICNGTAWFIL